MDNQTLPLLFPDMRIKKVRLPYICPQFMVRLQRSLSWYSGGDLPLSDNELDFINELYDKEDYYLDLSMSS